MPRQRLMFFAWNGDEKVVVPLFCLFLTIYEVYCEAFSVSGVRLFVKALKHREIFISLGRKVVYCFCVLCNLEYIQATYILTPKGGYSHGSFA